MCTKAVRMDPWWLKTIPDNFKTQEMCDNAVAREPFMLRHVPDWFVTQGQVNIWYDDDCCYDDKFIKWYDDYQKRKAQKAEIKK